MEERQRELAKWQDKIEQAPLPHDVDVTFECWLEYREAGVLPFVGGFLQQPQWIIDDFYYYDLIKELITLPHQIAEAKRNLQKAMKRK